MEVYEINDVLLCYIYMHESFLQWQSLAYKTRSYNLLNF